MSCTQTSAQWALQGVWGRGMGMKWCIYCRTLSCYRKIFKELSADILTQLSFFLLYRHTILHVLHMCIQSSLVLPTSGFVLFTLKILYTLNIRTERIGDCFSQIHSELMVVLLLSARLLCSRIQQWNQNSKYFFSNCDLLVLIMKYAQFWLWFIWIQNAWSIDWDCGRWWSQSKLFSDCSASDRTVLLCYFK